MNDRECFEADAKPYGFDITRSNYKIPSVEPWSEYEDIETGHRWGGFMAGAESKKSELDKANARIAQLEEVLKMAIIQSQFDMLLTGEELRLCEQVISGSSDTWLSEHDKAVEVRVLESVVKKESETCLDALYIVEDMIDARK